MFLATSGAAIAAPAISGGGGPALSPEHFGARGDGVTNDTDAFAAMSRELNRIGGGTVSLGARKTYIVGRQLPTGDFAFSPAPIIELQNLARPTRILGNGARLRCQSGLRYGSFSRATGAALKTAMPNYHGEQRASPYRAMIFIHDCRAPIEVRDIRLDGNVRQLRLGGPWGDVGWQIAASGLWLFDNLGEERIENVQSYDHGQDGMMISGAVGRSARSRVSGLVCRRNGRQGLSIVGGRGYDFVDCEFSMTGRSALRSEPSAGVDIEAEGAKTNRDLTFTRCRFIDNAGCGMVADSGDSADARFTDCLFVGTTTWSAWPNKPGFVFKRCTFAGAVVHPFADKYPAKAARFADCRFTDDPALSPTSKLYEGGANGGPIVNLAASENVRFERCIFTLSHRAVLPWSWRAIYSDCTMSQSSPVTAMTKGKYLGRTTIKGPVDLYGSMVVGTLIVNGKLIPAGPKGVKPW